MLDKKYNISLHFGNTQKTILEMDETDICYGLSESDKNKIIMELKNGLYNKTLGIQTKSII